MGFYSHIRTGGPSVLAWGKKVPADFVAKINDIADEFDWDLYLASCLMGCIAFESARTFSPSIKNAAGSGATGLIQFMPRTARGLGTSTEALAQMSALEQLDYVQAYFEPYYRRIKNLPDMYMAILMPKYVGMPNDSAIFSGGIAYRQNSGLDANHDGKVTKAEAAAKVQAVLNDGLSLENALPVPLK